VHRAHRAGDQHPQGRHPRGAGGGSARVAGVRAHALPRLTGRGPAYHPTRRAGTPDVRSTTPSLPVVPPPSRPTSFPVRPRGHRAHRKDVQDMPSSLPDSPSVDKLREQARQLQRRVGAADPDALGFLTQWHPRPDRAAPDSLALHDAQLAVARRYGFAGWPALVGYVETAGALSRDPATVAEDALDPADLFCALGCPRYDERDEPPRRDRAAALLADDPSLVHRSIWAAATAADPDAVRRHLDRDPSLGRRTGGPRRWEPLLYLCYSRVPTGRDVGEVLEVARVLLDAGADPDAGFL